MQNIFNSWTFWSNKIFFKQIRLNYLNPWYIFPSYAEENIIESHNIEGGNMESIGVVGN